MPIELQSLPRKFLRQNNAVRVVFAALACAMFSSPALAGQRSNPYACEGLARDLSSRLSLSALKDEADSRAALAEQIRTKEPTRSAALFCVAAELYKRLGNRRASRMYESAIGTSDEPAYELLYADFLRLFRGAGQRPLFPEAADHLFAARGKLDGLPKREPWDQVTDERLQRSLTALYERDGFALAGWTWPADGSRPAVRRPWLFFSPDIRWERSNNDFDRTSDVRDRTSEAAFSASYARLNQPLSSDQLTALVRQTRPFEGAGRVRVRYRSAPMFDFFMSGRRTTDAQITNFFEPTGFNDLTLTDVGASVEKPFRLSGNADAVARAAYHRIAREGLIEFLPDEREHIDQFEISGALSQYAGPDRINLSYAYTLQRIDSHSAQLKRDREIMSGTVSYQIFRPLRLPGRSLETGFGRQFEARGIDLFGGVLRDNDWFPASPAEILVSRRDYFVGVAVRGLKSVDVTIQPTWFTSQVSNDPTQDNSQMRLHGNVLVRLLDEERMPGMPKERLLGLPLAFVHVVGVFHWDSRREGAKAFISRRLGAELWLKCFTPGRVGASTLAVVGYSREWFPALERHLNLVRFRFGVGF